MSALPKFSPALALSAPLIGVVAVQTVDAGGYIKIGDIKGESTDAAHRDWIEIDSFSWGVGRGESADGSTTSRGEPVVIVKELDKSSPKLMLACAVGEPIPEATVALTLDGRNDGEAYYKVTFQDVLVTSYQSGGSVSDTPPTETISLNYSKITWTYVPADGSEPVVVSSRIGVEPEVE